MLEDENKEIQNEELEDSETIVPNETEEVPEIKEEPTEEVKEEENNPVEESVPEETEEPQPTEEVKEGVEEETHQEEPTPEETPETEVVENQPTEDIPVVEEEDELTKLRKEVEELRAARDEREAVETEEKEIKEVRAEAENADKELKEYMRGVADMVKDKLKEFDIPEDKTAEELRATDPAKAQILEVIIKTAEDVRDKKVQELQAKVENKATELVFKKAEKVFQKYTLTDEQADIAAQAFLNIMNAAGINDLKGDLEQKVELAVAQAKFTIPDVPMDTNKKEQLPAVEDQPVEKVEEETPPVIPPVEEKKEEVAPEPKIELDVFREEIPGNTANPADTITEENVLNKLNELPFKERARFYKEHSDIINNACRRQFGNHKK